MHIINGNKEKNIFNKKSGFGKWFAKNGYYFLLIACFGVIAATALWSLGTDGNSNTDINLSSAPSSTDWSMYIPTNTPKNSQDVNANADPTTTPKPQATKSGSNAVTSTFIMPVDGTLLEAFSMDQLVYSETLDQWTVHDGMDIKANEGSDVVAAAAGTVESAGSDTLMGNTVVINHGNGLKSIYSSLKEASVKAGDKVVKGQIIGKVGLTAIKEFKLGAHLHFAAKYNDEYVDPSLYLPGGTK